MNTLEKVRAAFLDFADAFLITDELNIRYVCGFDYTDGFLLITSNRAFLFADSRYIEAAKSSVTHDFEPVLLNKKRTELIKNTLPSIKRLAFENASMTCAELSAYQNGLDTVEFIPVGKLVEKIRNVKSELEKEYTVKAQRIAESAFTHILGFISPEATEVDIAVELEYYMRKNGADRIAFDTIAVSGSASSLPHGVPRRKRLEKGFLTMDFGAKYKGYCSDMTRTVCIGKPTEEMKRVYSTVLKAQTAALEYIAQGKKCADADKVARDIITSAGYGKCFGHSLGHGVGLYIHEPISLSPSSVETLSSGNIVTVEPGIYLEGRFGVRIEDMVYVTDNGNENLTKANKELIII